MGLIPAPILPTFPQAPLRSRTVGFPQSGSDLGFPLGAFPVVAMLKCWLTSTPLTPVCPQTRPRFEGRFLSAQSPRTTLGPPSAQSPFATIRCYRLVGDVVHLLGGRYPTFIAPTGSCARPLPSPRLWLRLVRGIFAGCGQPLLRNGPSRRYLCRSIRTCLDPYSGGPQGACTRFFPQDIGLPRV